MCSFACVRVHVCVCRKKKEGESDKKMWREKWRMKWKDWDIERLCMGVCVHHIYLYDAFVLVNFLLPFCPVLPLSFSFFFSICLWISYITKTQAWRLQRDSQRTVKISVRRKFAAAQVLYQGLPSRTNRGTGGGGSTTMPRSEKALGSLALFTSFSFTKVQVHVIDFLANGW